LRRPQPSSSTRRAFSSSSSSPSSPFPPPPASNPDTAPEPNESDAPADATDPPPRLHVPPEESIYKLAFTCRPCGSRSFHRISGQGYHKGTVLVTCPQCRSRHIISDHLCVGFSYFSSFFLFLYLFYFFSHFFFSVPAPSFPKSVFLLFLNRKERLFVSYGLSPLLGFQHI
jgi:hypothetical protein